VTGDRIALVIVGLAAAVLVVNLILALAAPEPAPEPIQPNEIYYPEGHP
jgi:hypothetical protein